MADPMRATEGTTPAVPSGLPGSRKPRSRGRIWVRRRSLTVGQHKPYFGPLDCGFQQAVGLRGFKPAACFDIWLATFHIIEMLYDTPFPTEPQNDLVPAQTERNEEIRARYEAGETGVSIAQTFGISEQRVSQIIRGWQS
jgi:hypothetical protein